MGGGPIFGGGGLGGGFGARRGGIGGFLLILLFLGIAQMTGLFDDAGTGPVPPANVAGTQDLRGFVSLVLGSTEDTWADVFQARGGTYVQPTLVLFSGGTESGCGFAQSAMGPFYCPADQRVYLDLDFLTELRTRFGAPGDFAQAYVIAHEVGHHVQNLTGQMRRVDAERRRLGAAGANSVSVKLELQADCYAGVWAARAKAKQKILEEGDIDEGLQAASAVGDDRLQMRSRGYVVPESFTHGSADQRRQWFQRGLQAGDIQACDTFAAANP
jgi:hypothetical protein